MMTPITENNSLKNSVLNLGSILLNLGQHVCVRGVRMIMPASEKEPMTLEDLWRTHVNEDCFNCVDWLGLARALSLTPQEGQRGNRIEEFSSFERSNRDRPGKSCTVESSGAMISIRHGMLKI
jgi:hypothetical protein